MSKPKKLWDGIVNAFKGGLFHILCGNILVKAIGFIASLVVIKYISKDEYAYLSYATNIYSYLSLISGLGAGYALLKYASSGEEIGKNYSYFRFALIFSILVDTIFVIGIAIITSIVEIPFLQARKYIYYLSLLQVVSCCLMTMQIFLRTQGKNKLYAGVGLVNAVIVLGVGYIGVQFNGAVGYVVAQYAGMVTCVIVCCLSIARTWRTASPESKKLVTIDIDEKKKFLAMGFSIMLSNLFSGMMPINETFLVNNIIKNESITANFRVAGLIPAQLLLISGAIVVYYFPVVAKYKDYRMAWKRIKNIGIITFALVGVITVAGMILTPYIIKFAYGDAYLDSINLSYVLWIMRFANAGIRIVPMNFLPALGKTKFNAWCSGISCVSLTIIDYLLLIKFGISGIAYGAILVYGVSAVALWIYLYSVCNKKG